MGVGGCWVQVDDNDDYNGLFLVLYDELFFSKSNQKKKKIMKFDE